MQDQEDLKMTKQETEKKDEAAPAEKKRVPVQMHITDIELEELQKEARENKDKYLRILAESENARKRLAKMPAWALEGLQPQPGEGYLPSTQPSH